MEHNSRIMIRKGSLWQAVRRTTENALRTGALLPIPTEYEFIDDGGVSFFVRVMTTLQRKDEEKKKQKEASSKGEKANPFLPYEEDLFVAHVSDTHVALLNKFNVVEHHLLIITRHFEDQETLLTPADFEALWACMAEYEGLGFYNGGEAAGASQKHKHLQMVPLPLAPRGPKVPMEPLLAGAGSGSGPGIIHSFPFRHVFVRLDGTGSMDIQTMAKMTFELYGAMLEHVGMTPPSGTGLTRQSGPYCFLATREWMLLVPRTTEFYKGVSLNSLAYAGSFFVRNEEQLSLIKEEGPLSILSRVAPRMEKRSVS